MRVQLLLEKSLSAVILGTFALAASLPAHANTWTNWTSDTGAPGADLPTGSPLIIAAGSLGGIEVTYSGESVGLSSVYGKAIPQAGSTTGSSPGAASGTLVWDASGLNTFLGVNGPPTSYNSVAMLGGHPNYVQYIWFSQPVTDPLIAIWSLGANRTGDSVDASFVFSGTSNTVPSFSYDNPVVFVSGGPSAEYPSSVGGTPITLSGPDNKNGPGGYDVVSGVEGSGVVEVLGTFGPTTPIMFITPTYEDYYAFTVGEMSDTPEPETLSLLGLGLLALPLLRSRLARRRRA